MLETLPGKRKISNLFWYLKHTWSQGFQIRHCRPPTYSAHQTNLISTNHLTHRLAPGMCKVPCALKTLQPRELLTLQETYSRVSFSVKFPWPSLDCATTTVPRTHLHCCTLYVCFSYAGLWMSSSLSILSNSSTVSGTLSVHFNVQGTEIHAQLSLTPNSLQSSFLLHP